MDETLSAPVVPRAGPIYFQVTEATRANLSQMIFTARTEVLLGMSYDGSIVKESIVDVVVLTMFFGLFTVLSAVAAYVLFLKGIAQKATAFMLTAILAMWASTAAYWIATLLVVVQAQSTMHDIMAQILVSVDHAQSCTSYSPATGRPFSACETGPPVADVPDYLEAQGIQQCTGTVALMANVIIGDAIVWWRAWVLWKDHRVVLYAWTTLVIATMLTGILDTKDACTPQATLFTIYSSYAADTVEVLNAGSLFGADKWGIATAILSLLTNMVATALIAYRAWEHRIFIISHLKGCSVRSQVERTLALLVESGVLYCALWFVVVVYQFVALKLEESAFAYGFYYVMSGCLIPLVGMYPTLIIILCALDKSFHEKSHNTARMSSPAFAVSPFGRQTLSLSSILNTFPTSIGDNALGPSSTGTPSPSEHINKTAETAVI
ncbi:hypothetical protein L226DRAFT_151187 [Lentinus tigrinus ALCF2SS1-7]|uniref:Uncharacterized protein n=1 Tax=Lentinus tigrinus ALCF2SS1-6 TaxID=1328759 RepID=A0A5C2RSK4_9APHY|nr:hypothetical protein L227DRAFT_398611 [Lentinus tigrinus ALCF2SS1-6]RPD72660.1 hypothetical protein L226DRAFT_151187 [Lentinus tigrinus ALCF2SS1-7]